MKEETLRLEGSTLWLGGDPRPLSDEDFAKLEELRKRTAAWNRARGDQWLARVGKELHTWLGTWADRLRARDLTLDVVADDPRVREAPWELLHDGQGFLVDAGFEVVRRLVPASPRSQPAPTHGLTLVFMAASPTSGQPRLRFEDEEAAILRAVDKTPMLLTVEETGTATGLGERLAARG